MSVDLFAGIPVRDRAAATTWYERLLGAPPSFLPNYIEVRPAHAGSAKHTVVVSDCDDRIAAIAKRGLEPDKRETYDNGVRKTTFCGPDGNAIGFGGLPVDGPDDVP